MIKLKVHDKNTSKFSKIDKFFLVPKKQWELFPTGEGEYSINGSKVKLWIHDIPCDCSGSQHYHRVADLRKVWDELGLKSDQEVKVEK